MNITSKDLNLLYVFQILMEERSVSKASKRLALTQPAVSNALSRLRRDFEDPLLVRSSKGMSPTPLALRLWPLVNLFCEQAAAIFYRESFDPQNQESLFRVATTDYFERVFLVHILKFLHKAAPNITMVMRPTAGTLPVNEMEIGLIDFAAGGFFGRLPEGFFGVDLFEETYCCAVRKDHPLVGKTLDMDTYLRLEHILVTLQGDLLGVVDRALAQQNLQRRIAAGVMSFHSSVAMVAESDYIATLPTRIVQASLANYPIRCLQPPLKVPGYVVQLVWHARTHSSRPHIWLRNEMLRLAREELRPLVD